MWDPVVTRQITPRLGMDRARELFAAAQDGWSAPAGPTAVEVEDVAVLSADCPPVESRIFRPKAGDDPLPVVLYAHGPGWGIGSCETHDRLLRDLAVAAGAAVVAVEFTRPPEARHPVQIEQCLATLAWVAVTAGSRRLDPRRVALAGDSCGANLAIATGLRSGQTDGLEISAQALVCPACDAACDTRSQREFARGPGVTRQAMRWLWEQYAPDPDVRAEITVSPLRATLAQLSRSPPTLVITAERDALRDEGEAYAARLLAAGVPVTVMRFQGVPGDFVVLEALRDSPPARLAVQTAGAFLYGALHRASREREAEV